MEPVIGIFKTRVEGQRATEDLKYAGISSDRLNFLTPGAAGESLEQLPTTETEQPGIGEAMGGVVGGAIGAAGGMGLGTAAASIFVPGVGPVIAVGLLGAALFGTGGAVGGVAVGKAIEEGMANGMPVDETYVYEDALRQGRSLVVVTPTDEQQSELARRIMQQAGAESIDSAHESWWVGLRDAEEEHYEAQGREFRPVESTYRQGFEAALRPQTRGMSYDEAINNLMANYPKAYRDESFRHGYERGRAYYQKLVEKQGKPARVSS